MNIFLDIYLESNLGDDLFLESIVTRYPEHNFYILTNLNYSFFEERNENLKIIKMNKYLNYGISRLKLKTYLKKRLIQAYDIQAIVCMGGSIFIEFEGWETLFTERFDLWKYMRKQNKKIFVIGSNFGPFSSSIFLDQHNKLFDFAEDVCFRDKYSFDLFKDRDNVRLEADVIMSFPVDSFLTSEEEEESVGISVINLNGRKKLETYQKTYINKILSIVEYFTSKNKKVYLLSFCEREGDEVLIETIMNQIEERRSLVDKIYYRGNIEDFLKRFSKIKKIIACRFHSIILSYVFEKEFYSFIYSDKSTNFIKDYQLNNHMRDIEEIGFLTAKEIEESFKKAENKTAAVDSGERQYLALDRFLLYKNY